jgi:alkaline phosphatase D
LLLVSTIDRRSFLRLTAVVAAGPALSSCGDDDQPATIDREAFPQSVASGDPRPDSVVLWTRALDPDRATEDVSVTLEVATDEGFRSVVAKMSNLVASAGHDHVVKVKVTNLSPRTRYHYRFRAQRGGMAALSPAGRTRTAPAPDDAVKIRFAFASCQDYSGRYYNAWQQLADRDDDLDFVLFLGDYIYETSGGGNGRDVVFSEPATALSAGGSQAALSLSNYRDLYRTFRSDPALQAVHEKYPFVVIWDDHEFSNDCWGAHATYTNGATDELEVERRRHAEAAFFEHMPIDLTPAAAAGPYDLGATPLYPEARIYRELTFGAFLRLLLTDYRSYRPDHIVPEDAYPGTVFATAAEVDALIAAGMASPELKDRLASEELAVVDIDALPAAKAELVAAATEEATKAGATDAAARAAAVVTGTLSLAYVNAVLMARSQPPLANTTGRGAAFYQLGKRTWFSSTGARYVLIEDIFTLYATILLARTGGASERAYGQAQEDWLTGRLAEARPRGWTVVASSVSMSSLVLDLRGKPGVPPALSNRFLFTGDQWDGQPHKKAELLARMAASSGGRTLVVAGDIHAAYASVEGGVPCLTAPAISSATASEEAASSVAAYGLDPTSPSVAILILALDALFKQGNPSLVLSNTAAHGVVVLDIDDAALATYYLIPATEAKTSYAGRPDDLRTKVTTQAFKVEPGKITPVT